MPTVDSINTATTVITDSAATQAIELDSLAFFARVEEHSYLSPDTIAFDLWQPLPEPHLMMEEIEPAPDPLPWETGMQGDARNVGVGDNQGVLAIVACVFTMMMLSYRSCKRLFASLYKGLFSLRRRKNAFNENTSHETRMLMLMAVQWCVCTGLLLYSMVAHWYHVEPANAFVDTSRLILLMGAYYVVQYCAYATLGYTYTDPTSRRLYLQGFTSSQSLLGFALIIPALGAIFYPAAAMVGIVSGLILYALARIVFIVKGFRIFYTNFGSLFYFILYLCTLEIIPLLLVWQVCITILITVD